MSTKLEAATKHAITVLDVVTIGLREALAAQAAEQRPQNCGTGFCSCIECPYGTQQAAEPATEADMAVYKAIADNYHASLRQAAEPSDEDIERILAQTLDEVAKHYGFMHAVDVQADITRNTYLRNAFARAVLNAAPAQQPLTVEQCFRIYNDATHAASIAVFMTRIDAESYGADDKGVSGWLQEAEDRVRRRIIKTKEGGAA